MKLLSEGISNPKIAKGMGQGFLPYILHLAPSTISGYNVCPHASEGCKRVCLNFAGRGRFTSVQQARIRKTKLFFENRGEFMRLLVKDLDAAERKATKLGLKAVVRLNGTSDLNWLPVILKHPNIQFYDYTKNLKYVVAVKRRMGLGLHNYHLTFSLSETNEIQARAALSIACNVAVVFRDSLPEMYMGYNVIDGTTTDLRFLDQQPVIVGLLAKGLAKKDQSGFVQSHEIITKEAV